MAAKGSVQSCTAYTPGGPSDLHLSYCGCGGSLCDLHPELMDRAQAGKNICNLFMVKETAKAYTSCRGVWSSLLDGVKGWGYPGLFRARMG